MEFTLLELTEVLKISFRADEKINPGNKLSKRIVLMDEIASAAPSVGSVPAPSSSIKTREFGVAVFKIDTIFVM